MNITSIETRGKVAIVKCVYDGVGDRLELMASSDRHHDSLHCDRALELQHLKMARERQAMIIDAGDVFDAMQGKYDSRKIYDDLRPEYLKGNYYDAIVDDAAEYYKPFASSFLLIGRGNHEASVYDRAGTDLTSRLTADLRRAGSKVVTGGVGGWIIFQFVAKSGGGRFSVNYRYHHGGGGNSPVTKGVIQTARQAAYLPDADIIHNGHNHQEYALAIKRERISAQGVTSFDLAHYIRTPGYKSDYDKGGWGDLKQFPPTPAGCAWVTVEVVYIGKTAGSHITVTADVR